MKSRLDQHPKKIRKLQLANLKKLTGEALYRNPRVPLQTPAWQ
jgi:hypothetical protein